MTTTRRNRSRIVVRALLLRDTLGRFMKIARISTAKSSGPTRKPRLRVVAPAVQLALF